MNPAIRRLSIVVNIGVAINILGMSVPFIFAPQWVYDHIGLPGGGGSPVWMRQAGLLLVYASLLYIPGGRDPFKYRWNAYFAVIVRMTIGLYWLFLVFVEHRTRTFLGIGLFDCTYAVINWLFLRAALKSATPAVR